MPLMIVEENPDEEEGFNDWVENPDWGDGDYEENVDLNTPGDEYTDDAWSDNFFENAVNTDDTETSDDDANESTPTQEEATQKTTRRRVQVIKRIKQDGLSPWIWVGIAGGAVLVAGGATLLFLYYKKKHGKKTATGNKVEGE